MRFKINNPDCCINNLEDYGEFDCILLYNKSEEDFEVIDELKVKAHSGGCRCKGCQIFNEYAEPNQEDNSFICYSCKTNPMRLYY
jgi:hypothetical protein